MFCANCDPFLVVWRKFCRTWKWISQKLIRMHMYSDSKNISNNNYFFFHLETLSIYNHLIWFIFLNFWRREESLPIFKRRLLGGLLDFAARELQVQVIFVCKCFKFPLFIYLFIFLINFPCLLETLCQVFGILLIFY